MTKIYKNVYFVKLSDNGSKFKLLYNLLILFFSFIFIIPHLIVFILHPKKDMILSDTQNFTNLILSLIFVKQYRNLFYYRVGNIKFFFKWILPEDSSLHVPVSLNLGKSALFVHNNSTFLNAKSIGDNFVCYHHVTIGNDRLGSDKKPVIGNDVTIYTGAVVVGDIIIGNNVNIGANAVVVKNVPSDSTVVGSPAKIVKLNGYRTNMPL